MTKTLAEFHKVYLLDHISFAIKMKNLKKRQELIYWHKFIGMRSFDKLIGALIPIDISFRIILVNKDNDKQLFHFSLGDLLSFLKSSMKK